MSNLETANERRSNFAVEVGDALDHNRDSPDTPDAHFNTLLVSVFEELMLTDHA